MEKDKIRIRVWTGALELSSFLGVGLGAKECDSDLRMEVEDL
jgi:hypothetical protein